MIFLTLAEGVKRVTLYSSRIKPVHTSPRATEAVLSREGSLMHHCVSRNPDAGSLDTWCHTSSINLHGNLVTFSFLAVGSCGLQRLSWKTIVANITEQRHSVADEEVVMGTRGREGQMDLMHHEKCGLSSLW